MAHFSTFFTKFTLQKLCIMKHITLSILLFASFLLSSCHSPRPDGLMVDMVKQSYALYQNGYPAKADMATLDESQFEQYQYAAIRSSRPTFGWVVPDDGRSTMQQAYRIIIADNASDARKKRATVWDSGLVESSQSVAVDFQGDDLQPSTTYFWRVMVATNHNPEGEWSEVEAFRTADQLLPYAPSYSPQVRQTDRPTKIEKLDAQTTLIDFGRASYASLELTLESDKEQTIYVAIGEDKKDGRINSKPHGTVRYYRYPLTLKAGRHTYPIIPEHDKRNTGPQAILMPDYIGEVAPMRYCQVEGYTGEITADDILRHTALYPFDDDAAYFESSDDILNQIWALCHYTIKATTALGIYIDGDRERIPYEADAIINQLGHYTTDREYAMARRSLEYLLQHPTWPTEWILQGPIIAWYDYLHTGDKRSIEANYDLLKARTLLSLRRQNGLISTTAGDERDTEEFRRSIRFDGQIRDIVDWMRGYEDDGFVFTDYNSVVNAYHYEALRLLQQMALLTGRSAEAEMLQRERDKFFTTFNEAFFDAERGAYRDGIDVDHYSQHASLFALAFELVPEEHHARVMEYIRSRDMACSVYASQFLMDAIYNAHDADYALHMLTKQDKRSWYNMLRAGTTITFEAWDNDFKPNQDWNHAWGAAPANIIPRRLVGVEPLTAGFEQIAIHPQSSTLSHVEARVPTIRGAVEVTIDNTEECYTLRVKVPTNSTAHITLPITDEVTLWRDGKQVELRRSSAGEVDCGTVGSGEWLFEAKKR